MFYFLSKDKFDLVLDGIFNFLKFLLFIVFSILIWSIVLEPIAANSSELIIEENNLIINECSSIIKLSNIERRKTSVSELKENIKLKEIAERKINNMEKLQYFSHVGPNGEGLRSFLLNSDYNYLIAGENLAINFNSNESTFVAWMKSASHRNNILNPIFKDIGIAQEELLLNGRMTTITVMILGREF